METIDVEAVVERDGEISLHDLPFRRGQHVRLRIEAEEKRKVPRKPTARDLLESDLVGMWADRTDIEDSSAFARRIREVAQRRTGGDDE